MNTFNTYIKDIVVERSLLGDPNKPWEFLRNDLMGVDADVNIEDKTGKFNSTN